MLAPIHEHDHQAEIVRAQPERIQHKMYVNDPYHVNVNRHRFDLNEQTTNKFRMVSRPNEDEIDHCAVNKLHPDKIVQDRIHVNQQRMLMHVFKRKTKISIKPEEKRITQFQTSDADVLRKILASIDNSAINLLQGFHYDQNSNRKIIFFLFNQVENTNFNHLSEVSRGTKLREITAIHGVKMFNVAKVAKVAKVANVFNGVKEINNSVELRHAAELRK